MRLGTITVLSICLTGCISIPWLILPIAPGKDSHSRPLLLPGSIVSFESGHSTFTQGLLYFLVDEDGYENWPAIHKGHGEYRVASRHEAPLLLRETYQELSDGNWYWMSFPDSYDFINDRFPSHAAMLCKLDGWTIQIYMMSEYWHFFSNALGLTVENYEVSAIDKRYAIDGGKMTLLLIESNRNLLTEHKYTAAIMPYYLQLMAEPTALQQAYRALIAEDEDW